MSVAVIVGALFSFSWVVVLLILLASLPSVILAFKASQISWSAFDMSSPLMRHAYYYRTIMTERSEAIKEVKT